MGSAVTVVVGVALVVWAAVTAGAFLRSGALRQIHATRDVAALEALIGSPVPPNLAVSGAWLLLRGRVVAGPMGALRAFVPAPVALVLVDQDSLYLAEPTLVGGRSVIVDRSHGELTRWRLGYADARRWALVVLVLDGGPYNAFRRLGWLPVPLPDDRP